MEPTFVTTARVAGILSRAGVRPDALEFALLDVFEAIPTTVQPCTLPHAPTDPFSADEPLAQWEKELLHPDGADGMTVDRLLSEVEWDDNAFMGNGGVAKKIQLIKTVRENLSIGLKAAKDLVDSAEQRERNRRKDEALVALRQKLTGE